jgi:hypothetical protein
MTPAHWLLIWTTVDPSGIYRVHEPQPPMVYVSKAECERVAEIYQRRSADKTARFSCEREPTVLPKDKT